MSKELRVLVVEDSEDDAQILMRELERAGFALQARRVQTAATLISALKEQPWDVILCDHSMPGFGSLAALEIVRDRWLDVPFIVVSGTVGEDLAVEVMKAGASDYVMKGKLARLVPSIERELREAAGRRARIAAESALRRYQGELEDFFEHAPVGLRWEGPDGTILRVNEAELGMLGWKRDEYVGRNISEFHADPVRAREISRRLNDGETLANFEVQLRRKDGTIRDVVLNSNVLRENGRFVHARCFTRDITEQKQAQTAVAYLAALVESSDDAIIGKTLEGVILTWNSGAERMYGYAAEEVVGRSISILVPPYRPEEWSEIYEKLRQGEWIDRYETVRLKKDGTAVDVSLTLSPIRDAAGAVIGVSAIERDITARRRVEEERLKLIEELTYALAKIKTLKGLLPICASCKKIRDDGGYWQKVESYLSEHTDAEFTHGLCPDCLETLYPDTTAEKKGRS
jgi:PAS domain S-box-containing protein